MKLEYTAMMALLTPENYLAASCIKETLLQLFNYRRTENKFRITTISIIISCPNQLLKKCDSPYDFPISIKSIVRFVIALVNKTPLNRSAFYCVIFFFLSTSIIDTSTFLFLQGLTEILSDVQIPLSVDLKTKFPR